MISRDLVNRLAAGPSSTRVMQVKRLHEAIRSALGDSDYETFLLWVADLTHLRCRERRLPRSTARRARLCASVSVRLSP